MATLAFSYEMRIAFSEAVTDHRFTLRCVPRDTQRQRIHQLDVNVSPEGWLCNGTDSFGNRYLYGARQEAHKQFSVSVTGLAETVSPYREPLPPEHQLCAFRMRTPLTAPGEAIVALWRQFPPFVPSPERRLERAMARMEQVAAQMRYLPGSTSHATTAEQAAASGQGVCQDYSHILLSLLHLDGIPCRYVCGMMLGEGASHAWVDVAGEREWVALDPTNRCVANEGYLIFSTGRNALDCQINRGVYHGWATQTASVAVRVARVDGTLDRA